MREPLSALGPLSRAALFSANIGTLDGPLGALLLHEPELHASRWMGNYNYVRVELWYKQQAFILERSDAPFADITAQFRVTERISLPPDGSQHNQPMTKWIYSFPLASMNDLIIAAKALMAVDALPPDSP